MYLSDTLCTQRRGSKRGLDAPGDNLLPLCEMLNIMLVKRIIHIVIGLNKTTGSNYITLSPLPLPAIASLRRCGRADLHVLTNFPASGSLKESAPIR